MPVCPVAPAPTFSRWGRGLSHARSVPPAPSSAAPPCRSATLLSQPWRTARSMVSDYSASFPYTPIFSNSQALAIRVHGVFHAHPAAATACSLSLPITSTSPSSGCRIRQRYRTSSTAQSPFVDDAQQLLLCFRVRIVGAPLVPFA